jgi:hypothetical protein
MIFWYVSMNKETQALWRNKAKGILKSEIALRNLSYADVVEKLKEIGIEETPQNFSNKITRGTFGAIFMVQVLTAIGCEQINFH